LTGVLGTALAREAGADEAAASDHAAGDSRTEATALVGDALRKDFGRDRRDVGRLRQPKWTQASTIHTALHK
jgi:hypothetical protein